MEHSPPASIDAERATLGSLLLNREAMVAVAPWLPVAAFYLEKHAWVYEACLACYAARTPPDLRMVAEQLKRRGRLDPIGGIAYLADLTDAVPTSYHVEYYARIVARTALLRSLIAAGGKIAALGYDEEQDIEVTIARAQQLLLEATARPGDGALTPIAQITAALYDELSRDVPPGQQTGLRDLDDLTGGLHAQDLIILAARPSVGKSALAMTVAVNVAELSRQDVLVFSLEMSRDQLAQRITAMHADLDLMAVRQRALSTTQLTAYVGSLGQVGDLPIWIDETPAQSAEQLRTAGLRFQAEHGPIGLIVVDYLQLMSTARRDGNRTQEVSDISRGLKALAKELRCPVLALSQLSRAVEQRASHVPLLSDLRESGQIEADADLVLFIHREELYDRDTDKKGLAELYIAKHRNGPLGVVPLRFDAPTTKFMTLTYRPPDGY